MYSNVWQGFSYSSIQKPIAANVYRILPTPQSTHGSEADWPVIKTDKNIQSVSEIKLMSQNAGYTLSDGKINPNILGQSKYHKMHCPVTDFQFY
jgi:hypothetical protein